MLVVRDLLLSPKRFKELTESLPRIPSSILSARLNELEQGGIVRRRVLPQLDAAVVYELTEYGHELEPVLLQLGLWGARSLGDPAPDDVFSLEIAILALHATFRPEFARGLSVNFELRFGDIALHALVDDGALKVEEGSLPDADAIITTVAVKQLMSGELTPSDGLASGQVIVDGDPALLERFVELFHIPPAPAPVIGLAVR